jgi:hypothetical protein
MQSRPVDISEEEQALDFFHGLDQARYAAFKTSMLNGWATKAFDPLKTVNDIYRIAGAWVKPTSKPDGGTAATFVTIEEDAKQKGKAARKAKEEKKKQVQQLAAAMVTAGETNKGKSGNDGDKVPKDLSHIQCFRCGEYGHYSTSKDCPKHESKKNRGKEANVNGTWGAWEDVAGVFLTIQEVEQVSVYMMKGLLPLEVLLDNQANISIVHPRLLKNVRDSEHQIRFKGVGGVQLIVDKVGDLDGFFQVYASENITVNILCFADVEDKYAITYEKGRAFTVHLADGKTVEFGRWNKLYVADWNTTGLMVYATVRENEQVYTHEEVRRAKLAYELVCSSGYPSASEVAHLIHDGNVRGIPATLSQADVERAYHIYGVHPEYVRGQMTNQKVSRVQVDLGLRSTGKRLRL